MAKSKRCIAQDGNVDREPVLVMLLRIQHGPFYMYENAVTWGME